MNKKAYVLVRTRHVEDIEELYKLGADQVIPEEFETAIELFERVLAREQTPQKEINKIIGDIRDHHYGIFRENAEQPVKTPGNETEGS
jgi:CPA2 family monovalent cation:H+ antiporter-2